MLCYSSTAMLLCVQTYTYVVFSILTASLRLFTMVSPTLTSIHKYLKHYNLLYTTLPLLYITRHSPADIVLSNLQRATHHSKNCYEF